MTDDFLADRRNALVDEFFKKEEAKKLTKYRMELAAQKTREELRRASAISDEGLLDQLTKIGLSADTLTALALAPLVHVAWADGKLQSKERDAILRAAASKGVDGNAPAAHLLNAWLSEAPKPPDALFATWKAYIGALKKVLEPDQLLRLETQVVGFAKEVAAAAGGFLGVGAVSSSEKRALGEIEAAFK